MKIAIDLNDVIRDFTYRFSRLYQDNVDKSSTVGLNDGDFYTNDYRQLFKFHTDADYNKFVYDDYAYELFGNCPVRDKMVITYFNNWVNGTIPNIDSEEPIELMIVSPMECGLSISSTYFFLSKIGCKIRETYFPTDSSTIWNKCDILITANPNLLEMKPENKTSIKIKADYNEDSMADYAFDTAEDFFKNENNIEKIINENGRK